MAKRAVKRKRTKKSAARKTTSQTSRRASKKPTKAAKRKTAARAAATRKRKPAPPKSTLATAAAMVRGAAATAVAAVTTRLPWAKNENDPIALLQADHRRFEKLLEDGEKSTERAAKGRAELLAALASELTVHEAIEEKVLYPALEPHAEAREVVLESFEEHHVADTIIRELKSRRHRR